MTRRRPVGNAALEKLAAITTAAQRASKLADRARQSLYHPDLLATLLADIAREQETIRRLAFEIRTGVDEM